MEKSIDTVLIIIARLHFFNSYVIKKQITWPLSPNPYYMRHFKIFDKIQSFLKNLLNAPGSKKGYVTSLKNRLI